MNVTDLTIDESLVSRLLLGALSEHEQRMITVELVRCDAGFRAALRSILEPFEMFDSDFAEEYRAALDQAPLAAADRRREILDRSFRRAGNLEQLIREFTVRDVLSLGEVTCKLFSWSMAEHLLQRSRDREKGGHHSRTSLYLALMVIDVVEILGAIGHSPSLGAVITDVRQRIQDAAGQQES